MKGERGGIREAGKRGEGDLRGHGSARWQRVYIHGRTLTCVCGDLGWWWGWDEVSCGQGLCQCAHPPPSMHPSRTAAYWPHHVPVLLKARKHGYAGSHVAHVCKRQYSKGVRGELARL